MISILVPELLLSLFSEGFSQLSLSGFNWANFDVFLYKVFQKIQPLYSYLTPGLRALQADIPGNLALSEWFSRTLSFIWGKSSAAWSKPEFLETANLRFI